MLDLEMEEQACWLLKEPTSCDVLCPRERRRCSARMTWNLDC